MTPDQFLVFADPLPEPMLLLAGNGLILAGNGAVEERLGLPLQALRGKKLADVVAEPTDEVSRYLRACSRSRKMVLGSLTLNGKDNESIECRTEGTLVRPKATGTEALLLLRLIPKASALGQFVSLNQRIDTLGKEIQRRKQAEEAARQEKERLGVTLFSIGDAVIVTDPEGRVTSLNPVAEALTGWAQAEAVGQPLETVFRIVHEKTRQTVESPALRALKEGVIVGLANHTLLIARDGTEHPIDDSAAPIKEQDGRIAGVVLVFRDVTKQRQAERSTRFLASIVESSEDAIISKDVDGIITSWNPAAERLFGYSAAEAVGRPIAILAAPDRADEMPAMLARIKQGERIDHFDTLRRAKDGRLIPISLTVSPMKDEEGHIVGASKIARDISERKRAEDTLRQEKARLHATLTGIGDAVIVIDAQSRVTLMNSVAQALTGWKEEATGRPLEEVFRIVNEQTRHPSESPVSRAMCEGTVVGLANHTILIAKDGTEIPIDDSAAPIKNEQGVTVGVVLVFRDVTEQRRAEAGERKNREILRFVHQIGKIGHWEWNSLMDVNKWSPEIEALYGLQAGTFEGTYQAWAKLLHPDDRLKAEEDVRKAMETGKYFTEFRVVWPDGSIHWLEARAKVFKDQHDKPVRMVGVNMDISERKRQEEALRDADRRKDEFLATLAHELRNPLAPLRNALQILNLTGGNRQVFEQTREMMERQLQQMVRLVDDLLDVSRITRGKIELRKERVGLAVVIQSAVETSRPLIEAGKHELAVALPSTPVYVDADLTRLAQVFSNLLNNSAKYTQRGGRIGLTVERQGSDAVVTVRDNGMGIPARMLPHIFEMFTQVDRTLERSQGGLGIGLTLVKRLVELHEGSIDARSEGEGRGSEFLVRLPAVFVRASQEPAQADEGPEATTVQHKHRILVVDDNEDSAESLAMMLRIMGNEVQVAHDGLAGVERVTKFQPGIVLLDIGMPKLNGYEAARKIRELPGGNNMVLVALTGWGQEEDRRRSEEAGFDQHMVKPVDPAALEKLLAGVEPKLV